MVGRIFVLCVHVFTAVTIVVILFLF